MRFWKPALGVVILLVLGFWDARLPSNAALPTRQGQSAGSSQVNSPASARPQPTRIPGVLQPAGRPEFSTTFSGSRLDSKVWSTCYPQPNNQRLCTNYGNREFEWYAPSQAKVYGGALHLTARREVTAGQNKHGSPKVYYCRSGMVTSYPGFRFKYGYLQVVARIPSQPGLWPALWLAAANLQWPPEIDILESWGSVFSSSYLHAVGGHVSRHKISQDLILGWHVFALSWTKTQVTWLVDGRAVFTVTKRIPHQSMYFIANLAEYKSARTRDCQGSLLIRSVKVWKR